MSLNEQVEGLKLAKIVDERARKADQRLRDTTQVSTATAAAGLAYGEMASLERDLEQQQVGRPAGRECEAVAGDLLETEMLAALAADRDDLSVLCDELTARAASAEESRGVRRGRARPAGGARRRAKCAVRRRELQKPGLRGRNTSGLCRLDRRAAQTEERTRFSKKRYEFRKPVCAPPS